MDIDLVARFHHFQLYPSRALPIISSYRCMDSLYHGGEYSEIETYFWAVCHLIIVPLILATARI